MALTRDLSISADWQRQYPAGGLPECEVHLWRVFLDGGGNGQEKLLERLSKAEVERAMRLRAELQRRRFIRSHAACRSLLARYAGIPAEQLEFVQTQTGKPSLREPTALKFNMSHSGGWMALAISRNREIGVDLEMHTGQLDWLQIAKNFFLAEEVNQIRAFPGMEQQMLGFYRVWTMKEAYLKASGIGIASGLRHVKINLSQDSEASFLELPGGKNELRRWLAFAFQPVSGAAGVVVVETTDQPVKIVLFEYGTD